MGDRTWTREGFRESLAAHRAVGGGAEDSVAPPGLGAASSRSDGGAQPGGDGAPAESRRSSSVVRDENGDICIGDGCLRLVVPADGGDVRVDLRDCEPDDIDALDARLREGAATEFKMPVRTRKGRR